MGSNDTRIAWYRTALSTQQLQELTARNNWRPLLHNVSMLTFSAATGAGAYWAFHHLAWPWVIAAVFFHCSFYGFFGGGAGGHELSHRNMFRTPGLNEFFVRFNGFFSWFNFEWFRRSHAGHHQYTVHHDLDLEVILPINVRWYQWIWGCTVSLPAVRRVLATFVRHAFGRGRDVVLKSEWEKRKFPAENMKSYRTMVRWARIVLLGHAALAAFFVASGNWILLILVTFAPFCASWFGMLVGMPQHVGMRPDVADWRQSTRTYLAGPVVRFFYWNMNYHVEHHMYAAVPFYNLPKLRKAIESDLPIASRGLVATWREIRETVRRQKADPAYYYSPELPATAVESPV